MYAMMLKRLQCTRVVCKMDLPLCHGRVNVSSCGYLFLNDHLLGFDVKSWSFLLQTKHISKAGGFLKSQTGK